MELKDFIKTTIVSISEAIKESQAELSKEGVIVNPEKMTFGNSGNKILRDNGDRCVQDLDFDVSIFVEEKSANEGKGELKIASIINAGSGVSSENSNKTSNRIRFSIPIAFSSSPLDKKYCKINPGSGIL